MRVRGSDRRLACIPNTTAGTEELVAGHTDEFEVSGTWTNSGANELIRMHVVEPDSGVDASTAIMAGDGAATVDFAPTVLLDNKDVTVTLEVQLNCGEWQVLETYIFNTGT
jgi:hypothetical protein